MRTHVAAAIVAGALVAPAVTAFADYPEKPIEVIVGFSAGGGTDVMARTVAPFLEKYLGEGAVVVVKNVPGASGQIALTQVAQSQPDGYTLGTYNLPGAMARTLERETGYDADSFTYLANVVNDPNVVVTSRSTGFETLARLLEAAKADPGAITVGMSSLGGDDHFFLIKLQEATGTEFTIVPFKGSAPARTAVLGGHVSMGIFNVSEVAAFREELEVLCVATAARSDFLPDVPTCAEAGVNIVNGSWRGFVAPAGLSPEVEAKLLDAFRRMAGDDEFLAAMKATANPVEMLVGEDFRRLNSEVFELAKRVWETSPWN